MGQQHRKETKRRRRAAYIKRQKEIAKNSKNLAPVQLARKVVKEEAAPAEPAPEAEVKKPAAKKAPAKKPAAKKAPAKKPAAEKEETKKAPAKKPAAKKAPAKKEETAEEKAEA